VTFTRFCQQHGATPDEREELIWHLIALRIRILYKLLARGF
jgi:hypothetical protein